VLLTTQYLEEADQLARHLAVADHGRVIATGSPEELKVRVGGRIDVMVRAAADLEPAAQVLAGLGRAAPDVDRDRRRLSAPFATGSATLPEVVRLLDAAGVDPVDVGVRLPTLDEVFLTLTGAPAAAVDPPGPDDRTPTGAPAAGAGSPGRDGRRVTARKVNR
jgi:ABC-2 type transport system ATP-binding protein